MRTQKCRFTPCVWFLVAIMAVPVGLHGQTPSRPAVDHAESLSAAFRSAAGEVLPTVVKIKSSVTREQRTVGPRENPFRGTPFEDFFDEEMAPFGNQFMPRREGTGSGVIISSDGIILTNNHVVSQADEVTVELSDGRQFEATEIRTDPKSDLAVVRIEGAGQLPAAKLGDSEQLRIGDWVLAIGNPFELSASVSAGIVSAKGRSLRSIERASFLQTDAAINPGNSGGPLVNLQGEVVGINTAIASSSGGYQGIGFAIPVNLAKWVTDQLLETGSVSRGWLGVGIEPVSQRVAEALGIDVQTDGVFVTQVGENTPAEKAGVQPGDIIVEFAGREITRTVELQRAVERSALGKNQKLVVLRDGRRIDLTVVIEALPSDEQIARSVPQRPQDRPEQIEELGLQLAELTPDRAGRLGLPRDVQGVLVARVQPGSVARQNGVQVGMVIKEVDGQPVRTPDDVRDAISDSSLDEGVILSVRIPNVGSRFIILKNP